MGKDMQEIESTAPLYEAIELIEDAGGQLFKLCYQCGLCDTVCPWNRLKDFSICKIVRQAGFGLIEIEDDEIWQCSTCLNCVSKCPRGVPITDIIRSVRRIASEYNVIPQPVRIARGSLSGGGNPWMGKREERGDWTGDLSVKAFTGDMEVLYFPCCTNIYDARSRKIASSTVNILNSAGVEFGILSSHENCCGESIRKTGEEDLFRRLAKENIKAFIDNDVKKIITASPHCFYGFIDEYPEFKVNFEIIHLSQFIADLIREGKLDIKGGYYKKVTYHDPCYLGRHKGVYDVPREILNEIPGLELVEMSEIREDGVCCGGGGGRIWMETPKNERLSDLRLRQALDTGSEVLATFCPYCIINFEDSRLNMDVSSSIEIKDVTEIISDALSQDKTE